MLTKEQLFPGNGVVGNMALEGSQRRPAARPGTFEIADYDDFSGA